MLIRISLITINILEVNIKFSFFFNMLNSSIADIILKQIANDMIKKSWVTYIKRKRKRHHQYVALRYIFWQKICMLVAILRRGTKLGLDPISMINNTLITEVTTRSEMTRVIKAKTYYD